MQAEYCLWSVINDIYIHFTKILKSQKQINEFKNVLERFLLNLANSNNDNTDIFPTVCPECHVIEMIEEIKHKNIALNTKAVVQYIKTKLDMYFKIKPTLRKLKYSIIVTDNSLSFGKFKIYLSKLRLQKLIEIGGEEATTKLLLRYSTILAGSQHWRVPVEVYKFINSHLPIDIEGFASPINSQLMMIKDNARFCSVFEADKIFGSLGSFFNLDIRGKTMTVMLPYVPALLVRAYDKISQTLESTTEPTTFIVGLPGWYDADFINNFIDSKYTKCVVKYGKGECYFQDQFDKPIIASSANCWCLMSNIDRDFSFMKDLYNNSIVGTWKN